MSNKTLRVGSTGFTINIGNTYMIGPKADPSAPQALLELRTTKLPNDNGRDTFGIPFDDSSRVYDTGLYPYSPSLSGMKIEEAEAVAEELKKLVIEPLERVKGPETLSHLNNEYWDSHSVDIYNGKVLDTSDPSELLELYHMILFGFTCPKGRDSEYDSTNADASYTFEDVEKTVSLKDQKNSNEIKAIGLYYSLITQQDKLELVLYKMGMPIPKLPDGKLNEDILNSLFKVKQKSVESYDFNLDFITTSEKVNTKKGYKELTYYRKVHELYKSGDITKEYELYKLDGITLGNDLDVIVDKASSDKNKEITDIINVMYDKLVKK